MNSPNFSIENEMYTKGYQNVCGVDEAGRGPLVGDVYAAAVILPKNIDCCGINDSKKLSPQNREKLYDYIIKNAVSYGIARATPAEIDEINIRNATFLAMSRAIEQTQADYALIDGNAFKNSKIPYTCVVKGDSKSISIAAASILAKVARDRAMEELDKLHPEYGFAKHKGYPTSQHYAAISEFGILQEHRKTFKLEK